MDFMLRLKRLFIVSSCCSKNVNIKVAKESKTNSISSEEDLKN